MQFYKLLSAFVPAVLCLPGWSEDTNLAAISMPIPLVRQATGYTCGVAALQAVLGYYGVEVREDTLSHAVKSTKQRGTAFSEIALYAAHHGCCVKVQKQMSLGELEELLEQRKPVILAIQAWAEKERDYSQDWDDGHYVVAVGCDQQNIYFMDPSTLGRYTFIPKSELESRWHDSDGQAKFERLGIAIWRAGPIPGREPTRIE